MPDLPTPLVQPPQALARRALLAALPALCVLPGLGWPLLAAQPQHAPPNPTVRRTRQRFDTLTQLLQSASTAQRAAEALLQTLQGLASPWQAAQDAAAPTQAALETWRGQALPTLATQQGRWLAASTAVDTSAAAHRAAVASLLDAQASLRGATMARLDAATTNRLAAEATERAARQVLAQAMGDAESALGQLVGHWQDLARASSTSAQMLSQAAQGWAGQQRRWQALQAEARAAGQAGPALPALPSAAPPWAGPDTWAAPAAPDPSALQAWRSADRRAQLARQALWLQADAQAAVQQALADALCSSGCSAWQADAGALQASLATQQTAWADARADQAATAQQAQAQGIDSAQQLQALLAWRDSLAPAVASASGPAQRTLQAAIQTGQTTLARLTRARDQAEAAWIAALRQQYGNDALAFEAPRAVNAGAEARMAPPAPAPMAMAAPMLNSHALHRLRLRGDEPDGFGAYTYVLVGAGVRPDTLGVHARLQRLLGEVRNLPVASTLDAESRARANSFVVPVPADSRDTGPLLVDLPLAQSLLTHLPPVLRLADATRRLLYAENGPFLITLPGRLADARSDWPLLFADLSKTPEVVVADVVRRYMADLIGSFSPASTDWAPPAGMQVGIALVRLVKGSGNVVQAVFPSLLR